MLRALTNGSIVQPALLSRMNERQVLRTIQARGPLSRAEVARHLGMSAPTASKTVEALLRAGLLEEGDATDTARGRPARRLRLATETAQVLGLAIDADLCRMVPAGLDGRLCEERAVSFRTPDAYEELLDEVTAAAGRLADRDGVSTLGLGISLPGLIDYRMQRGALSPNVGITNGRTPGLDLSRRLGIECVLVQEAHALCLAERCYGAARECDDFAVLDVTTGVGLGVMSGGQLLTGHSGLAGEIGHVTVQPEGRLCGCGNRGCLETVACDRALCRLVARKLQRPVDVETLVELLTSGSPDFTEELSVARRYLSIGLSMVINLFNPSTLFVHSRVFSALPELFEGIVEETRERALGPNFADCRMVLASGSKRQGAVAAVMEHLTSARLPMLSADLYRVASESHAEPV